MSSIAQKGLLALSVVFILAGLGLTIAGVFSPAWQVVDIREFRAEHQFDNSAELVIENTLNNIDEDGAAGESEHHRFWVICSLIADGVFFLAANRVDNRFVQGMVGTYEQRIGYAFYLHIMGTVCWVLAFICAITTTYKFVSGGDARGSHELRVPREEPLLSKYPPPSSSQPYRPSPQPAFRPSPIVPNYRETSA
ncbi:Clc-like protein [Necator americanus]|uniref:Clc-like protein n=1 Tax=Necator americanus TaxID=51031 RepID=W2SPT7_NECAM|nr:Clc-like protein [Necator americanus]ETN70866.1 Clc-like protein [Necator americanus]